MALLSVVGSESWNLHKTLPAYTLLFFVRLTSGSKECVDGHFPFV